MLKLVNIIMTEKSTLNEDYSVREDVSELLTLSTLPACRFKNLVKFDSVWCAASGFQRTCVYLSVQIDTAW